MTLDSARSSPALLLLGTGLIGLVLAGLSLHIPGELSVGSDRLTAIFVAILACAALVYFVAVALVLRQHRLGAAAILLIAAALRLGPLLAPPFLSSDVYRYVWDGRVQAAGINPYRYIPADPALATLRDDAIYPYINRRDYAPTIYPPAAQLVFALVARVSPTVQAMKIAMVLAECIGLWAMLRLLDRAGLPRARLLIYAWNPLAVWDYAGNGHVDALAVGFVGLALLARASRRDSLTGMALAAAALVKFLPIAIAPALWRRWGWRAPLACLATIAVLYALYSSAGSHILGFLGSYTREENLTEGSGFWLLAGLAQLGPLPSFAEPAYLATALIALAILAALIAVRWTPRHDAAIPPDDIVRFTRWAQILAACLIFAISPHYPWYFPWLGLFCCISPLPSVIYLSAAPLLLYLDPIHEHFVWPSLVYVPAIALAVRDLATARARPLGGPLHVHHHV